MLKKVISLLLVLCLLGSSVGCGGGNPVVPPDNEESGDDIIYIQDTNPEDNVLVMAGKDDGEVVTILGEKDAFGNPIKITGVMYISEQGDAFIMDAGDDGLPTYIIDSEGNKVIFTNYSESTVEISIYNSNEELLQGPITITVDPSDLTTLKQLYSSVTSKNKDTEEVLEFVLKYGGLGLSVLACVSSISSGIVLIIAKVCASTLVSAVVTFYPGTIDNWIASSVGAVKCFGALTKPWEILACARSIWSLVNLVYEGLTQADEEEKIENVISGFFQALNNQEWDNALSYCVFGSELFYEVYSEEELFYQEVMYFTYSEESFGEIIINGEYAQVSVYFTMSSFLNGELLSEYTTELIFLLQKIGNSWKIYDCGGPEPPPTAPGPVADETKIQNVIHGFIQVLNNQDWDKARSYCVYNSPTYYDICELEEQHYNGGLDINYFVNINNIIINNGYAELYGDMTTIEIINGIISNEQTFNIIGYFQKIGDNWKIYETIPGYNPITYF